MGGRVYSSEDRRRVERLAPLGAREISRQTGISVTTILRWLGPPVQTKPRRSKVSRVQPPVVVEHLGSVAARGDVHAAYPSADRTLCGVRFDDAVPDPRGPLPDCADCEATARAYDAIDGSAPSSWRKAWSE